MAKWQGREREREKWLWAVVGKESVARVKTSETYLCPVHGTVVYFKVRADVTETTGIQTSAIFVIWTCTREMGNLSLKSRSRDFRLTSQLGELLPFWFRKTYHNMQFLLLHMFELQQKVLRPARSTTF